MTPVDCNRNCRFQGDLPFVLGCAVCHRICHLWWHLTLCSVGPSGALSSLICANKRVWAEVEGKYQLHTMYLRKKCVKTCQHPSNVCHGVKHIRIPFHVTKASASCELASASTWLLRKADCLKTLCGLVCSSVCPYKQKAKLYAVAPN